jgi:hypothetical protein
VTRLPLEYIADDARVSKPDAQPVDFAFGRVGTVIREQVDGRMCLGVLWDGETRLRIPARDRVRSGYARRCEDLME